MSETVSIEFIGRHIRQLQSDVRSLRDDNIILHKRLDQIVDRIATFETVFETRLDQQTLLIDNRFDQLIEMMKANK